MIRNLFRSIFSIQYKGSFINKLFILLFYLRNIIKDFLTPHYKYLKRLVDDCISQTDTTILSRGITYFECKTNNKHFNIFYGSVTFGKLRIWLCKYGSEQPELVYNEFVMTKCQFKKALTKLHSIKEFKWKV